MILIGYGTYVRPEGCFPAQPINPVDAAYFQTKIDELDGRLEQVAATQSVEFFDTKPLSIGHDICAEPEGVLRRDPDRTNRRPRCKAAPRRSANLGVVALAGHGQRSGDQ